MENGLGCMRSQDDSMATLCVSAHQPVPRKRMLSHLGEELRNCESFLTDSNKFIVEGLGSHVCARANVSMMTAEDWRKLLLLESNAFRRPVSLLHELLSITRRNREQVMPRNCKFVLVPGEAGEDSGSCLMAVLVTVDFGVRPCRVP
jgi:hypothetical protein